MTKLPVKKETDQPTAKIPHKGDFRYLEFRPNYYKRSFELGAEVDQEKIQADYKQGVLTLHMPKQERTKNREIIVNVNNF